MPTHVLLVDSNDTFRYFTAEALTRRGCRVLQAQSGAEACQLGEGGEGPIHVLVSEARLSDMTGAALLDRLRAARPGLPAILVGPSGAPAVATLRTPFLPGVPGVATIRKPYLPLELFELVEAVRRAQA